MDRDELEQWIAVERLIDRVGLMQLYAMLFNLGRCLRDAGALCAAFDGGYGQGVDDVTEGEGYQRYMTTREWMPGCGHPAPGVNP